MKPSDLPDLVTYFYEHFLASYNPELRTQRGVYYTPKPVVSFIVRSVDKVLRDVFDIKNGLADTSIRADSSHRRVTILDPAVGTGTFLREIITHIKNEYDQINHDGDWSNYIQECLIPSLYGFEIMPTSYMISHLNLQLATHDAVGQLDVEDPAEFNIFLSNALEPAACNGQQSLFAPTMTFETKADEIKNSNNVMVVLGNPPYSGESANNNEWIADLLAGRIDGFPQSYYKIDGKDLGERNSKWLSDDYNKFIRLAQYYIDKNGEGIVSFVTNNRYLDAPLFRGMRKSLMDTFDKIYIINLHGNILRHNVNVADENIFDIKIGTAIALFIKTNNEPECEVYYVEKQGTRESKYDWLSNNLFDFEWNKLEPQLPHYLFIPVKNTLAGEEYSVFWSLDKIFKNTSTGIITGNDDIALQFTKDEMIEVGNKLKSYPRDELSNIFPSLYTSNHWNIDNVKADLSKCELIDNYVKNVTYQNFDSRFIILTGKGGGIIHGNRHQVMKHLANDKYENVALLSCRQRSQYSPWAHVFVSNKPVMNVSLSNKTGEIVHVFPLWTIQETDLSLFDGDSNYVSNFSHDFIAALEKQLNQNFVSGKRDDQTDVFDSEDVFGYIYGILHSTSYRQQYEEYLRHDYPRVPLPIDNEQFVSVGELGNNLVSVHLLKTVPTSISSPQYSGDGNNLVESVRYEIDSDSCGKVWVNDKQYFNGVSVETWEHDIGAYQPARLWLLNRRGRTLTVPDIEHYKKMCTAISQSISVISEIDRATTSQQ